MNGASAERATRRLAPVLLGSLLLFATEAHALREFPEYRSEVAANYRAIQHLSTGMTRAQVEAAMGHETTVRYDRLQLHNPWRRERVHAPGNLEVEVLYYVTQGDVWRTGDPRHALTPVVLENGVVAGWGWRFLDRNRGRYASPSATK